jgi:mRNA interferase RelE/StbE
VGFYKVIWKRSAKKELKKLPKDIIVNIISAVESLKNEPRPVGVKKLVGTQHTYRQRIGNYRIVYSIENELLVIEVVRIGHRKDVYRNIT